MENKPADYLFYTDWLSKMCFYRGHIHSLCFQVHVKGNVCIMITGEHDKW